MCAVNARNIFVLNYVSPFRVGRHIVFVFTVFCPHVCPYGDCPSQNQVRFTAWNHLRHFLWNLIQIQSIIMQIARLIILLYTFLELRLFNVVNSIFLSQHHVHCIIWKPFRHVLETLQQYKSSSDHVQSSAYVFFSFCLFVCFFLSLNFRVTRLWTLSMYTAASVTCLLYKLETDLGNFMTLSRFLSHNHKSLLFPRKTRCKSPLLSPRRFFPVAKRRLENGDNIIYLWVGADHIKFK